jgi:toxin ParE1/3/4
MRQREVVFSDKANSDLRAIYRWLSGEASPYVAFSYVNRITDHIQKLDLASERGTKRDDVASGLRIIGFENRITVAFTVAKDQVNILRVFYGGQNWEDSWKDKADNDG